MPHRRSIARLLALCGAALCAPAQADPLVGHDCILAPHAVSRLGAAAQGLIAEIRADRGDRVRRGDVLLRLESTEEESRRALARLEAESGIAVDLAERRIAVTEMQANRAAELGRRKVMPLSDVEDATLAAETARLDRDRALLDQARAREELAGAEAAVERKTVRAPFDGVVVERRATLGEMYNQTDPLFVIAGTDPLYAETYLPARAFSRIAQDMEARIDLEDGSSVRGRVILRDPVLDPATGTFGIRLAIPNPDGTILSGLSCEVHFDDGT